MFEIPYPTTYTIPAPQVAAGPVPVTSSPGAALPDAPMGKWKYDLCSCCDLFCKGLFWMALFCTPITQAQILTRLKLDACGLPTPDASATFGTVLMIFVVHLVLFGWLPFVGIIFLIYTLIYGTRMRKQFRDKYQIPVSGCCGRSDCMDDCCCIFWCGCCTSIQMIRQYPPKEQYPYNCCTLTGLPPGAPAIF